MNYTEYIVKGKCPTYYKESIEICKRIFKKVFNLETIRNMEIKK